MTLLLVSTLSIVVVATLLAVALFYLAHRRGLVKRMEMPPTTMGSVFALVGTVFSILVAFSIVVVWGTHSGAASIMAKEANALGNLEQLSRGFSVAVRRQVQEAVKSYATLVIEDEWPKMSEGLNSERVDALLTELWHIYTDMSIVEREHPVYNQSLARLNDVSSNRRLRLLSRDDRVPPILWTLLTIDGLFLLLLSFQFDIGNPRTHSVIVGLIASIVSLAWLLIATLDQPYDGLMALRPEPFQFVLENLQRLEN